LVVEDDPDARKIARDMLAALGFVVESASDGSQALHRLSRGPVPDLLLLDVHLPDLDAVGVMRVLRRLDSVKSMQILAASAVYPSTSTEVKLVDQLGAIAFLPKPFTLQALREAIPRELRTDDLGTPATPSTAAAWEPSTRYYSAWATCRGRKAKISFDALSSTDVRIKIVRGFLEAGNLAQVVVRFRAVVDDAMVDHEVRMLTEVVATRDAEEFSRARLRIVASSPPATFQLLLEHRLI